MAACHVSENAIYSWLQSTRTWCNKYQQLRGDGSNEGRNEILPFMGIHLHKVKKKLKRNGRKS